MIRLYVIINNKRVVTVLISLSRATFMFAVNVLQKEYNLLLIYLFKFMDVIT